MTTGPLQQLRNTARRTGEALRLQLATTPVWLAAAVLAAPLRLVMLTLPGAGRDEAAYAYWSQNPELAYAPLLQALLWAASFLPLPALFELRIPVAAISIAVLWVFDKLLEDRSMDRGDRFVAVSVLALSPWQTYVGTIVHPDNLLFLLMLGFVFAAGRDKTIVAVLIAAAAALAKPSGLLVLGSALGYAVIYARPALLRAALPAIVVAAPMMISMRADMVWAISQYGLIDSSLPAGTAAAMAVLPTLLLGGPLAAVAAMQGLHARIRQAARGWPMRGDLAATLLLGCAMLLVFGAAAVLRGQIKANWLLPAFFLLWPLTGLRLQRAAKAVAIAFMLLSAGVLVTAFRFPAAIDTAEEKIQTFRGSYSMHAGQRESKFVHQGSWSARVREYQDASPFAGEIASRWAAAGQNAPPAWIVSDDYGTAAQLLFAWGGSGTRMIIPGDGIFSRTVPSPDLDRLPGGVLILAVNRSADTVWERLLVSKTLGTASLPGGGELSLALAEPVLK